jgi:hypothetical protein
MASEKEHNMSPEEDQDMASIKNLKLVMKGKAVEITDVATSEKLYHCAAPRFSWSAALHHVRDGLTEETIAGGIKLDGFMGNVNFRIDPNVHHTAGWTQMKNESRFLKVNDFSFETITPTATMRQLHWKGSHVGGVKATIDPFNLKLVDSETGIVVARFLHKFTGTRVMDGVLKIGEDLGEEWDRKILLSCLAVLKYNSFMWNWNIL